MSVSLPDGGEKNYFECPHCRTRYVYAEITPAGMMLRERIQQKQATWKRAKLGTERQRVRQEIVTLQRKLEAEISKYIEEAIPVKAEDGGES